MTTWTDGYVSDIGYTYGYYSELNPLRINLAFLQHGLACPEIENACELGFGQGMSVNLHAAASNVSWWGTDFNPSQASFAQDVAKASGAKVRLFDDSFVEFASRSDLPEFDYIGLHGIWSWVSDENRAVLVEFIRRKLKAGGVVYISYNTMPGWAAFAPLRHLMLQYANAMESNGIGIEKRIDHALSFAEKVMATNPLFAKSNPKAQDRLNSLRGHGHDYLAHEYFNRDWRPMHFAELANRLGDAKIDYACSANYVDFIDAVNLTAEQQNFLQEMSDPLLRQSTKDFMVNQQFRKDYWVRGARKLSASEQVASIRSQRVVLVRNRQDVVLKLLGNLGEATMSEAIYSPILDLMADHVARSIGEIEQKIQSHEISFAQLVEAVMMLSGAGYLNGARGEKHMGQKPDTCRSVNEWLVSRARWGNDLRFLASPVTGGGIEVGRFQQLFLESIWAGKKSPKDWAQNAWKTLDSQGERVIKDGNMLDNSEDNLNELTDQARYFEKSTLPMLSALGIA